MGGLAKRLTNATGRTSSVIQAHVCPAAGGVLAIIPPLILSGGGTIALFSRRGDIVRLKGGRSCGQLPGDDREVQTRRCGRLAEPRSWDAGPSAGAAALKELGPARGARQAQASFCPAPPYRDTHQSPQKMGERPPVAWGRRTRTAPTAG